MSSFVQVCHAQHCECRPTARDVPSVSVIIQAAAAAAHVLPLNAPHLRMTGGSSSRACVGQPCQMCTCRCSNRQLAVSHKHKVNLCACSAVSFHNSREERGGLLISTGSDLQHVMHRSLSVQAGTVMHRQATPSAVMRQQQPTGIMNTVSEWREIGLAFNCISATPEPAYTKSTASPSPGWSSSYDDAC